MADIALTALATANRCVSLMTMPNPADQKSLPAAEAITAGAGVRLDTTNGRWTNSNASTAAEARTWGVAMRTVVAGENLTAVRNCILDGYDLSALAYDQAVFVSNTDGRLADAAGTVSAIAGRVVPGPATTLGTAYDKVLELGKVS
jgi:hypothetical protein